MVTLPLWVPFGLVLLCAIWFRAVAAWIVIAAIVFALYFTETTAGASIRHGLDRLAHPSATSSQNPR